MWRLYQSLALFILITSNVLPITARPSDLVGKDQINLLVVHSFEPSMVDYQRYNNLISSYLKEKKIPIQIQTFYVDCNAYDRAEEIQHINNYLNTIMVKPDIILVTDDQATYSLLTSQHPLLKNTPIIFTGVNHPDQDLLKDYPNVTGFVDLPDYEKNIEMIEKLMGVKRIRFFYDRTINGKMVLSRLAEQYKEKDKELCTKLIRFIQNNEPIENDGATRNTNDTLRENDYSDRPLKTTLHFINIWDDRGRNAMWSISGSFKYSVYLLARYDFSTANVGRISTVPTFSATNKGFMNQAEIVGGYFTPLEDQIREACEYIHRIAQGEHISKLAIKELPKRYVLDWTVLNRWKHLIREIPEEIEVLNMPFYVKYKPLTIALSVILSVFIVLLILYLLFLYYREARRKRQAQMNLWEEKEFLSLAMEGSSIFACRYNPQCNEFHFDKEFTDSIGLKTSTLTLGKLSVLTHPDDLEQAMSTFLFIANSKGQRGCIRARVDFNEKGYMWYEFRLLNTSGVWGNKASVIGLLMNIQDYKDKEQELTIARDLASKAELKQSFLANMSHEIRTPLNAIVGFSNMLINEKDLPSEEKVEFAQVINLNCELLLKLINDILEISRIESGNVSLSSEPCNLNELVQDVHNMCILQIPNGVEFFKNTPSRQLLIETDALRLKQILVNFVSNAFKFTKTGHISIGLELDKNHKEVCLYVEDTGSGIPQEHQKMIFDRFYKVDEFAQGTGLGLSICKVIVTRLGGRITLTSEVNKGSRFNIRLPYVEPSNRSM